MRRSALGAGDLPSSVPGGARTAAFRSWRATVALTGAATALATALDLPAAERSSRARVLRKVIEARSPLDWFDDQRAAARTPR